MNTLQGRRWKACESFKHRKILIKLYFLQSQILNLTSHRATKGKVVSPSIEFIFLFFSLKTNVRKKIFSQSCLNWMFSRRVKSGKKFLKSQNFHEHQCDIHPSTISFSFPRVFPSASAFVDKSNLDYLSDENEELEKHRFLFQASFKKFLGLCRAKWFKRKAFIRHISNVF